jgi:hypothetical protein
MQLKVDALVGQHVSPSAQTVGSARQLTPAVALEREEQFTPASATLTTERNASAPRETKRRRAASGIELNGSL